MSHPSKIHYYPNLTIAENAKRNGVSVAGMNYYIRTNNIDRRYINTTRIIRKCREYYLSNPDANKGKVAKETGYSRNIVNEYWEYITKGIPYTKMHQGKAVARQELKKKEDAAKVQTKMLTLKSQVEALIEEEHKNTESLILSNNPYTYPSKADLLKAHIETYKASEYLCYAFRRKGDTHKGEQMPLGNMCGGFPFELEGQMFPTSENAYICGLFSTSSKEHQSIQKRLVEEQNGYLAKKEIRAHNIFCQRLDWKSYNVEWMLYCVWCKVQGNKEFREALLQIPYGAAIIENSTFQKVKTPDTSAYWGCRNKSIKDFNTLAKRYIKTLSLPKKTEGERMLKGFMDDYCNVGEYIGVNEMGKILMYVKECLHKDVEPEIDYALLRSKDIYILGKKASLLSPTRIYKKVSIEQPLEPTEKEEHAKEALLPNAIIGAMCGDIIGSRYEMRRNRVYTTDFELFPSRSQYTDDTIHTTATMDWLLNDSERSIRTLCDLYYDYSLNNKFGGRFCVYGGDFKRWVQRGEKELYRPSDGNGACMRVSPIGWAYDSIEDVEYYAEQSAITTHKGEDSERGAKAIAVATLLARQGYSKDEIRKTLQDRYGWDLTKTCSDWRERNRRQNEEYNQLLGRMSFAVNSVPPAILAFLEGDDFESCIRLAVSVGGDADTIAAMTGGIAEAAYGVPEHIRKVVGKKMTPEFIHIINAFTQKYGK